MKGRKEVLPLSDATDAPIFTRERGLEIIRKLRLMDDDVGTASNARILPLPVEWMRTYLLLRRRGTA
jgi:hypothetical protein